jgi:beta-glucosidase-like glycosyl hydrolase
MTSACSSSSVFKAIVSTAAHPIVRDITERNLSGVILFGRCLHSPESPGNITSPAQLRALNAALCRLRAEPLLIGVDQEGGAVQRLSAGNGFSDYPSASQLGYRVSRPPAGRRQAVRRCCTRRESTAISPRLPM